MKIANLPSPNYFKVEDISPSGIQAVVLHGTDGDLVPSISWLRNPKSQVSANYVISKAGDVFCLVDPAKGRAWANGPVDLYDTSVRWLDDAVKAKFNPNYLTVSIEHEATDSDMRFHRSMPDAQFNSSIELTAMLLKQFCLRANHNTIIAHCQIAAKAKPICPGVIFVPAYLEVLLKRHPELAS